MDYNTKYNFIYPDGEDFYNVEDFNGNFSKVADQLDVFNSNFSEVDEQLDDINSKKVDRAYVQNSINQIPVKKLTTKIRDITSSDLSEGDNIIIAEKGHYSNGAALIFVEASGSLKHHSLILGVSTSFISNTNTIVCLGSSAYATPLFNMASVETVWAKDHKIYLTLNTDIKVISDSVELKITVISDEWNCCTKILKSNEALSTDTQKITLTSGKLNLGSGSAANLGYCDDLSDKNYINNDYIPTSQAVTNYIDNVLSTNVTNVAKYCYVVASEDTDDNLKTGADFVLMSDGSNFSDFQDFVDNLNSGSMIKMLAGIYSFTDTLVLNKSIIIEGNGHGVNIKPTSPSVININNTGSIISNVTLKNINLNYEVTNGSDCGKLLTMQNVNGVYIYNVRFGYNIEHTLGSEASLIKGSGYLRNIHIHDCVMNEDIVSPVDDSYTIDFNDVTSGGNTCIFISGCSYNSGGQFAIKIPDSNYINRLALSGFTGRYSVYDSNNVKLKTYSQYGEV